MGLTRATKSVHLLHLAGLGRPQSVFRQSGKTFTCGFVNTYLAMVGTLGSNVVDGRISWHTTKAGVLAALEAEEFDVALGDHHVDVGDFHLSVNVGLVGAVRVASPRLQLPQLSQLPLPQPASASLMISSRSARVVSLMSLLFAMTFLDSLVATCRACLVDTGGLCPS